MVGEMLKMKAPYMRLQRYRNRSMTDFITLSHKMMVTSSLGQDYNCVAAGEHEIRIIS